MTQSAGHGLPAPLIAILDQLTAEIAERGWTTVAVLPVAGDTDPVCVYTVGLYESHGLPELSMYGVPPTVARELLTILARRLIDRGSAPEPGERFTEVAGCGLALAAVYMIETTDLCLATRLYGEVPAVQVVWPDPAGLMPWQPGCRQSPSAQPLRGLAPDA